MMVLPAYAGMFPASGASSRPQACSPRVCGDVSDPGYLLLRSPLFSPRMRGCFLVACAPTQIAAVLPAYAGMFLSGLETRIFKNRSPRVCGDVSIVAVA